MMDEPKTEAEQFAAETDDFRAPGAVATDAPKDGLTDKPAGQGDDGKADDTAPAGGSDVDATKATETDDDKDGTTEADRAAAADGTQTKADDDGEAGKGEGGEEGEPKEGEVPAWMKKRLERSKRNETAAEEEARKERERRQELEEENARLKAEKTAAETPRPDPDDFDNTAAYEDALADWKIAQREAAKAKEKPAATDDKPKPAADGFPLGITRAELVSARDLLSENLPPTVVARLKDPEQVKVFPPTIMLTLADEEDKDQQTAMARFVIGQQKTMRAIATLPPRQQAAAFVRAFTEADPVIARRRSNAPEPLKPVNNNGVRDAKTSVPSLSAASFEEFEKVMNEADMKEGRRIG